jgi:hypothetical protein
MSIDQASSSNIASLPLLMPMQGILKGEVSLYHWPPVW